MKAGDCIQGDRVRYEGDPCKYLSAKGDSVILLNERTQRELVLSRYHSVTMIERKRQDTPLGHEWRVYLISEDDKMNRRPYGKGFAIRMPCTPETPSR